MAVAQNPRICDKPISHSVQLDWHNGKREVTREDVYVTFTVDWLGDTYDEITMQARKYVTSSGWTPWMIHLYHTPDRNGLSDTARTRISDVCKPLVDEYLHTPKYDQGRRNAFRHMIRTEIRDENYNPDRPMEVLDRYAHELNPDQADKFYEAIRHLRAFLDALED